MEWGDDEEGGDVLHGTEGCIGYNRLFRTYNWSVLMCMFWTSKRYDNASFRALRAGLYSTPLHRGRHVAHVAIRTIWRIATNTCETADAKLVYVLQAGVL